MEIQADDCFQCLEIEVPDPETEEKQLRMGAACMLCDHCQGFVAGPGGWCSCGHPANKHW